MRIAPATALLLAAGCASAPPRQPPPPPAPPGAPEVRAVRVSVPPMVDGVADDAAWAGASETEVPIPKIGGPDSCRMKAVVHGEALYLQIRWKDPAEERPLGAHTGPYSPWGFIWITDLVELTLPIDGPFPDDPLTPAESTKDLWRWDAMVRDRWGHARDGRLLTTWHPDPADRRLVRTPVDDAGSPGSWTEAPSGSAADVLVRGAWSNGEWTLEWSRALSTGNRDDRDLAGLAECPVAIQILDGSVKREFLPSRRGPFPVVRLLLPPPLPEDRQRPFPEPRGAPRERR